MEVNMVVSFKGSFCIKYIFFALVLTLFSGCSKDQKKIPAILAVTSPLGCMVGAAIGKKLAHNKTKGATAGAVIVGTVATVASVATGGILFAAASTAFNAITQKLFKHKKKREIKNEDKVIV
jgi:hypothetical protein